MLKHLLSLTLIAFLACAGVAHAQGTVIPAPTPPNPAAAVKQGIAATERWTDSLTAGEVVAIGVGVVVGVTVFEGMAWDGLVIVGAVVGGWAGDYFYKLHTAKIAI